MSTATVHRMQLVVRGSGGQLYTTVVYFEVRNGSDLEFEFADCSCPVGFDCKHAVALARSGDNPDGTSLAIELTLAHARVSASHHAPQTGAGTQLLARLVRPGKTGWVAVG